MNLFDTLPREITYYIVEYLSPMQYKHLAVADATVNKVINVYFKDQYKAHLRGRKYKCHDDVRLAVCGSCDFMYCDDCAVCCGECPECTELFDINHSDICTRCVPEFIWEQRAHWCGEEDSLLEDSVKRCRFRCNLTLEEQDDAFKSAYSEYFMQST